MLRCSAQALAAIALLGGARPADGQVRPPPPPSGGGRPGGGGGRSGGGGGRPGRGGGGGRPSGSETACTNAAMAVVAGCCDTACQAGIVMGNLPDFCALHACTDSLTAARIACPDAGPNVVSAVNQRNRGQCSSRPPTARGADPRDPAFPFPPSGAGPNGPSVRVLAAPTGGASKLRG